MLTSAHCVAAEDRGATERPVSKHVQSSVVRDSRWVRIASWDLHDLWHEPGVALRSGMERRNVEDFRALRRRVQSLDAEVVALQGIGSPQAARMLFPARDYFVIFSRELAIRQQQDRDILNNPARRRVYNAIAIRRSGKIRVLAREHILETADPSPALGDARPQGQSALAVRFRVNKRPVWVVSARLLPGCNDSGSAGASAQKAGKSPENQSPHCTVLRDQMLVLNAWKSRKLAKQDAVVMAIAVPEDQERISTNTTAAAGFQTLLTSDPVKVVLAYNERKREEDRRRGGVRRFVLTNPVAIGGEAGEHGALQPNTVPFTGPSRAPGQRLATAQTKADPGGSNLIVDALTDFAKAAFGEKRKNENGKVSTPRSLHDKLPSLGDASVAALARIGRENLARGETMYRTPDVRERPKARKTKAYFVRYPNVNTPDACQEENVGSNFILLDKVFHQSARGVHFEMSTMTSGGRGANGAFADCAVHVDIPLRMP